MPRKGHTPRKTNGTPRNALGKKVHPEEAKPGNTQVQPPKVDKERVEKMVKDIFAKEENKKARGKLNIAEQQYFDKKYGQEKKRRLLEAKAKTREAKRRNAESEKFLRNMCAKQNLLVDVQNKYTHMVDNMMEILKELKKDEILKTMQHALKGKQFPSSAYKNEVLHYADKIKKMIPKVKGTKPNNVFEKFIQDMENDSEQIILKRNGLYRADNIYELLKSANEEITDEQIEAVKKLIHDKLQTTADAHLKSTGIHLTKEAKEEVRANRASERDAYSDTSSKYMSSNATSPRIVTGDTPRGPGDSNE